MTRSRATCSTCSSICRDLRTRLCPQAWSICSPDAQEDRAALRHELRPHSPRGQHVRLRPSAMPYATPVEGLYSCSAGCHPAGSVIGAAGYVAAQRILQDLDAGQHSRRRTGPEVKS